jgi:hypothetical protein
MAHRYQKSQMIAVTPEESLAYSLSSPPVADGSAALELLTES